MPQPPPADSDLPARLAAVEQREAWYRAKSLRDILEIKKALKLREQEVFDRRQDLETRETSIHQLHQTQLDLCANLAAHTADLEHYAHALAAAEHAQAEAAARLNRLRATWSWSLAAPLRALQKKFSPLPPASVPAPAGNFTPAPGRAFTYYLHTTPFRLYPADPVTLRGWIFSPDHTPITALRARVDHRFFDGTTALPEPEVAAQHALPAAVTQPGFTVTLNVPPGRHDLALEVQLADATWFTFLTAPVWGRPSA